MIERITSNNNPLIKKICKQIKNNDLVLIESEKVFNEFSLENYLTYLICTQEWLDQHQYLKTKQINIIVTSKQSINKLSLLKNTNNDVLYLLNFKLNSFMIRKGQKYLVLDNIQDPGNMANIIRTCVGLNCQNIFISKNSVNPLNNKVIRTSVGAIFKIKINFYDDLRRLILKLKNEFNYEIIASCVDKNATFLKDFNKKCESFCLLVGNEGKGLDKQIINQADQKIFINIQNIDSLNVASATAIILHWLINN